LGTAVQYDPEDVAMMANLESWNIQNGTNVSGPKCLLEVGLDSFQKLPP